MSELVHQYRMRPHQEQALLSDKRHVALFCGVGAGKTDVLGMWSYKKLNEAESWPQDRAQGIIAANTYDQLYDSTLRNLFDRWRGYGIRFRPERIPKAHRPLELEVLVGGQWRVVLCRSLSQPDSLAGIEVGWFAGDEVFGTTPEALNTANARVRSPLQPINQSLYATTLDDPGSWLHETFVENFDPERMEVIYAPTWSNAPNLPEGYVDDLKAFYSGPLFNRMVAAEWVSLEAGQIYYSFNRDNNITEHAEFEPKLPVHWSHDQNISVGAPMSSVLFQIKRVKGGPDGKQRHEMHVFDEIVVDSADTNDVIEECRSRDWFSSVGSWTVGGDPAGRARDTRSKQTDYSILAAAGFKNCWAQRSHPPIRTRHNTVNALLKSADGDVKLKVHPRCKALVKGFETVKLKKGAQYLEKETREQHVTTAVGYGACVFLPLVPPKRGRKAKISMR